MPSRSALNPVSFIRPGTGSILMPNDGTEPDPIIEKPPLIRDWHGGFLETDLSRHGVYVRMGPTRQKRRRPPKASRQKARAEGCDEPRGRPGKPQKAPSSAAEMAPYISRSIFCGGGSVGSPQTPIERNPAALRHKRALKALLRKAAETTLGFLERNRRRVRSQPANFADYWTVRERRSLNTLGAPLPGRVCHRALRDIWSV